MNFQNSHVSQNQKHESYLSPAGDGINIWVIIGYISAVLGGLFGMFIGSILMNARKVLPDGEVIYKFNKRSRKHGKIIMYLSSVVVVLAILFFMNWFFLEKILFEKRYRTN